MNTYLFLSLLHVSRHPGVAIAYEKENSALHPYDKPGSQIRLFDTECAGEFVPVESVCVCGEYLAWHIQWRSSGFGCENIVCEDLGIR